MSAWFTYAETLYVIAVTATDHKTGASLTLRTETPLPVTVAEQVLRVMFEHLAAHPSLNTTITLSLVPAVAGAQQTGGQA